MARYYHYVDVVVTCDFCHHCLVASILTAYHGSMSVSTHQRFCHLRLQPAILITRRNGTQDATSIQNLGCIIALDAFCARCNALRFHSGSLNQNPPQ